MGLDWIRKGQQSPSASLILTSVSPNTIEKLYGADLTVSTTNFSLLVSKGGILLAQVIIEKIVSWSIEDKSIIIITSDPVNLYLGFVSNAERNSGLYTLENAINL